MKSCPDILKAFTKLGDDITNILEIIKDDLYLYVFYSICIVTNIPQGHNTRNFPGVVTI